MLNSKKPIAMIGKSDLLLLSISEQNLDDKTVETILKNAQLYKTPILLKKIMSFIFLAIKKLMAIGYGPN